MNKQNVAVTFEITPEDQKFACKIGRMFLYGDVVTLSWLRKGQYEVQVHAYEDSSEAEEAVSELVTKASVQARTKAAAKSMYKATAKTANKAAVRAATKASSGTATEGSKGWRCTRIDKIHANVPLDRAVALLRIASPGFEVVQALEHENEYCVFCKV